MRIDAIYLVAPEPEPDPKPDPKLQPPSVPTRRAFLMAAGALVLGAGGGGACGYSMGVAAEAARAAETKPAAVEAAGEPGKSSGDAELDYWRGVAQGPLDELFEHSEMFIHVRLRDYPKDQALWSGIERIVRELRSNAAREVPEAILATLAAQIDGVARPPEPSLREFVPLLRARRQELRRKR